MNETPRLQGVLAPVVTPFREDYSPDPARFIAHCRWLLSQHTGLAVFGTNSEANSQSAPERMELLEALVAAGVDPARMMPGTGCCALTDTIRLTTHAVNLGCAGVLMLPPFYYKDVTEDGLYRTFSDIIQRVGDARLRIYLYHIPPVAVVGISLSLIERLLKNYPGTIAGVKDSSGNWQNTQAMLDAFAASGFDVFVGSETFLLANMRHGGTGCISATANVNPAAIHALYASWQDSAADVQQEKLNIVRDAFGKKYTMIAALKQAIAHFADDPVWATVRPPLMPLTAAQTAAFLPELDQLGFTMPGLKLACAAAVA
ncbi:MAG: dihydrodipicolinate synthase family protein [Candidatus Tectomicrobia bacterium]|uniref:Dihydrodipicolinate synthase family protein n=1 Tax=Tectimicrobiota bacterium TaxID=2528274 RepID=A0A938AZS6_UNCTE|nr:dihydrodipicolinate synthase family protein [Candidatus Tectomicrobia bacterium]